MWIRTMQVVAMACTIMSVVHATEPEEVCCQEGFDLVATHPLFPEQGLMVDPLVKVKGNLTTATSFSYTWAEDHDDLMYITIEIVGGGDIDYCVKENESWTNPFERYEIEEIPVDVKIDWGLSSPYMSHIEESGIVDGNKQVYRLGIRRPDDVNPRKMHFTVSVGITDKVPCSEPDRDEGDWGTDLFFCIADNWPRQIQFTNTASLESSAYGDPDCQSGHWMAYSANVKFDDLGSHYEGLQTVFHISDLYSLNTGQSILLGPNYNFFIWLKLTHSDNSSESQMMSRVDTLSGFDPADYGLQSYSGGPVYVSTLGPQGDCSKLPLKITFSYSASIEGCPYVTTPPTVLGFHTIPKIPRCFCESPV